MATECELCHDQHLELVGLVKQVADGLEYHIAETHRELVAREELLRADKLVQDQAELGDSKIQEKVEQIVDTLLGPKHTFGIHQGERDEGRGLERRLTRVEGKLEEVVLKVGSLHKASQNGGVPARLKSSQMVPIWVAVVSALGAAVVSLITALGS